MAYIVQRKDRFYVVDYDGIDPVTGRERRRWRAMRSDAPGRARTASWSSENLVRAIKRVRVSRQATVRSSRWRFLATEPGRIAKWICPSSSTATTRTTACA